MKVMMGTEVFSKKGAKIGRTQRRERTDTMAGKNLVQRMGINAAARTAKVQELCSHEYRRMNRSKKVCVTCGLMQPLKEPKVEA